jgi:hypothetical protein
MLDYYQFGSIMLAGEVRSFEYSEFSRRLEEETQGVGREELSQLDSGDHFRARTVFEARRSKTNQISKASLIGADNTEKGLTQTVELPTAQAEADYITVGFCTILPFYSPCCWPSRQGDFIPRRPER